MPPGLRAALLYAANSALRTSSMSAITPSTPAASAPTASPCPRLRTRHRTLARHVAPAHVRRSRALNMRHQLQHRFAPGLQRRLDRALRVANPLALQLPRRDLAAFKLESVNAHFAPLIVR